MVGFFKNILVPVDFSVNTEVAVKQAIELAYTGGSTIHLLHVIKPTNIWSVIPIDNQSAFSLSENYYYKGVMIKLQELKQAIEESLPNNNVKTYVVKGAVHDSIIDAAKLTKPQLVIIGKKSNSKFFTFFTSVYPNEIAKSTGCPVLTVMRGSTDAKIKIIVVPIRSFIPKRKIELVALFAKRYRAKIHLVTSNRIGTGNTEMKALLDTYRILKTGLTNPIEYHLLKGNNFAKATLDYANRIGADMLFVNPCTETKISKLTCREINDMLAPTSKLKILSVEPY